MDKILHLSDKFIPRLQKNGVVESAELVEFLDRLEYEIPLDGKSVKIYGAVDTNITPLKSFEYFAPYEDKQTGKNKIIKVKVDYSNIEPGSKCVIRDYQLIKLEDGAFISRPIIADIQSPVREVTENWSEGLDRHIKTIKICKSKTDKDLPIVAAELEDIGQQMGFNVEVIPFDDVWFEDVAVVRQDGMVYIPFDDIDFTELNTSRAERYEIISDGQQGRLTNEGSASEFALRVDEGDKVYGSSYLEGGNVLNTRMEDGTAAAVIGEESIQYTLAVLELPYNEKNVEQAKNQIAKDLGLKKENITFIPQIDFHIDMSYRPLHNGEIACPDYKAGAELLEKTEIEGMSDEMKETFISYLSSLSKMSEGILNDAENRLKSAGYKIVKVPCFSDVSHPVKLGKKDSDYINIPKVNYMNGIAGTSEKNGTFYITNVSNYSELDNAIQQFFENYGIDNVFFVSTQNFLIGNGGIDCLTLEIGKGIKKEN